MKITRRTLEHAATAGLGALIAQVAVSGKVVTLADLWAALPAALIVAYRTVKP